MQIDPLPLPMLVYTSQHSEPERCAPCTLILMNQFRNVHLPNAPQARHALPKHPVTTTYFFKMAAYRLISPAMPAPVMMPA